MGLPRTTPGRSPGRRWPWGIAASLSSAAAGCTRPSPWKTPPSLTTVPPWSAATRPTPGTCGKGSADTCGECAPADRLILASDALTCWFLAKNAAGQKSWETLLAFAPHHAPRRHEATALGPGPADEPSRGVRGEPAGAQADRGGARLAEDCRGREEAALLRRGPQRPVGGDGSGGVQPRAHRQAYAPALISGGGPCQLRMTCPNRRRQRPDQGPPTALLTPNRRPTVPQR